MKWLQAKQKENGKDFYQLVKKSKCYTRQNLYVESGAVCNRHKWTSIEISTWRRYFLEIMIQKRNYTSHHVWIQFGQTNMELRCAYQMKHMGIIFNIVWILGDTPNFGRYCMTKELWHQFWSTMKNEHIGRNTIRDLKILWHEDDLGNK